MKTWVECQNDDCKFRTSGFAKGKERRKRIVSVYLEGGSYVDAECPVCHEHVVWKADADKLGLLVTGPVADLVKGVRVLENFVFDDVYAKRFVMRCAITADELSPKKPEIVPDNTNVLDKKAEDVLVNIFGKM